MLFSQEPVSPLVYVNKPRTGTELESMRLSVSRDRPFGLKEWTRRTQRPCGRNQVSARVVGLQRRPG